MAKKKKKVVTRKVAAAKKKAPVKKTAKTKVAKKPATKKKTKKTTKQGQILVKSMPIRRHLGSERTVFANHVLVRDERATTVKMFFFDAEAPLVVDGDDNEIIELSRAQKYVDAQCVARVALPMSVLPELIKVLQTHLERSKAISTVLQEHGVRDIGELKAKLETKK